MSDSSSVSLNKCASVRTFTFEAFRLALSALQKNPDIGMHDNKVIILTNFGQIICGTDDKESIGEMIAKNILQARDTAINNFSEMATDNDDEMLLLKNVVIIPFANPQVRLNYNVVTIFVDQIVGFSIGNLSYN